MLCNKHSQQIKSEKNQRIRKNGESVKLFCAYHQSKNSVILNDHIQCTDSSNETSLRRFLPFTPVKFRFSILKLVIDTSLQIFYVTNIQCYMHIIHRTCYKEETIVVSRRNMRRFPFELSLS